MSTPSVAPRPTSTRSICGNRVNRLFLLTFLALAGTLIPHRIQAESVGEMNGFWRRATMVDTHLKGGGGLGTIPGYVTDPSSSFPYIKRPFPTEYPHADSLILVRTLGGWHIDRLGIGEAAAYSDIEEADVVTWDGANLQFDKGKFIDRIRPFVDAGYHDLTIVLDNIPWSLSGPHASQGNYGNKGHAQYPVHMRWVARNVSQWLVEEFGPIAENFTFRYGTETEWGGRYTGTAWNYFQEYNYVARGLHFNLPNAKLGPGNFWKLDDSDQQMKLKEFLGFIENAGEGGPPVDFLSASRYLKTSTTGVDESPAAAVGETMDYFDSLQALHPTLLAHAVWKIDEFGFVGGTLPESQPGAYGGALVFNMMCGLLQRGIGEMQHWHSPMVYDGNMSGGNASLWTSLSSIFTIFDHLQGGQAYVRSITPLLDSAEGISLVVKKDEYTYIILSAADVSRSTQPTQNFTYSFPDSEATFTDPQGVKVEYLSLDRATVPHDILRNDLALAGLLVPPFSDDADWVSDVNSMAGSDGQTYLNQNFEKYSQAYIDAMTLKAYSGSLTRSASLFHLAVENMRTPSIMVFRLSREESEVTTAAFARIFRDHAVLQRGKKLPIWGFAPPGQQLTVRFGNQSLETVADPSGAWQTALEPLEASFEPERLILTDASGETLHVVENLLVGEVWVLGGQSNMAWWLKSSDGGEAAAAQADYPWLRVFDPGWQLPDEPARDAAPGAKWTVCTPATAGSISAIGFWFAEALHRTFEVPVGLVQTAVSGTYGESWVPREVLEAIPEARPRLDEYQAALEVLPQETERWEAEKALHEAAVVAALEAGEVPPQPSFFVRHGPMGPNHFQRPYALFNGRIAPVAPFAARGVVWYQGEGNTQKPRAPYYDDILRGLLASWRKVWKEPELPFLIIQLPRFVPGIHNDWPMVREKQFEVAQEDPHASLVTTIDLGDPADIHPRDKERVAGRVTLLALSLAYGQSGVATGPLLQSVSKRGGNFQLTFSQTGEGLRLSEGDTVRGFVFETETGETLPAVASLSGPNTVTLAAPGAGATPIRIRYAAENLPDINLINSAGLPAAPFRFELSMGQSFISIKIEAGNVILTFDLKAGQRYHIQSSQDLAKWDTWTLNVPAGEFDRDLKVTDDGTYTNPHPNRTGQRFYRLIEQGPDGQDTL